MQTYTAMIQRDGEWWIGWIVEVTGANAQARTRNALLKELKIVLIESLAMSRANQASGDGEVKIITSDGETLIFTTSCENDEKGFQKALDMVNARFGHAMKRLAE